MKTLNKTLSLILALAMVFGLMGVASAAFTDQSKITHTTAVDTCVALNIINGRTDGSYDPTGIVTRAELCKMICVAYNGGVTPTLATTTTPTYTDTASNWASAYIEYCTKLGIVAGNGDGTFSPDATVTGTQAAKMMLIALGYNAKNEGFTGTNWDTSVNVRANEKKLYDQLVSFDPATGLTRDNAAQMIYNMLQATEVEYTYSITTDASGKVTTVATVGDKYLNKSTNTKLKFVTDKYDLDNADGIVKDVEYDKTTKLYTITLVDAADNESTYTSTTDYENFYRQNVRILYKTDTDVDKANVYGLVALKSSVVLSGVLGQLSDATIGTDTIKFNGTTYKFDTTNHVAATPLYSYLDTATSASTLGAAYAALTKASTIALYYKAGAITVGGSTTAGLGVTVTTGTITAADLAIQMATLHQAAYSFKMIDNNGDGKIDLMVVTPIDVAKITAVSSTQVTATSLTDNGSDSYTFDDNTIYSGVAKTDYAKVTASVNTVDGKAKLEKITPFDGAVTETTAMKATIGGVTMGDFTGLAAGKSYTGLVQSNGFIWAYKSATGAISASDYAVVISAGTSTTEGAQAKLLFSDGTKKTVDTKENYGDTGAKYYVGQLVKLTKSSSDVYTLSTAAADLNGDFDIKLPVANDGTTYSYSSSTKTVASSNYIDDSAVVFVKVTGASAGYKVMTGSAFKTVNTATIYNAYGAKSSSTGYGDLTVVYATITSTVTTGDELYGYVTSTVTNTVLPTDSSVACNKVTFWDGSATKTLYTDKTYSKLAKGQLFQYTLDTNGNMVVAAISGAVKSSVSGYNGTTITFTSGSPASTKITSSDTTVMYIDSSNVEGIADGTITYSDDGTFNAFYVDGGSGNPFTLVIYDMSGSATTATLYSAT